MIAINFLYKTKKCWEQKAVKYLTTPGQSVNIQQFLGHNTKLYLNETGQWRITYKEPGDTTTVNQPWTNKKQPA